MRNAEGIEDASLDRHFTDHTLVSQLCNGEFDSPRDSHAGFPVGGLSTVSIGYSNVQAHEECNASIV
jgi:hypothetical protein